ncbi:cell division protein SepF [Streptacidiphilus sp. PAMC 29251]
MGAALRDDYRGWLAPSGTYPVAVPDYEEPWDSPELVPAPHAPQITSVRPTGFESARIIGEHVRVGTPVIMDLTEMSDGDAKRLVDFASGLTFGTRGSNRADRPPGVPAGAARGRGPRDRQLRRRVGVLQPELTVVSAAP